MASGIAGNVALAGDRLPPPPVELAEKPAYTALPVGVSVTRYDVPPEDAELNTLQIDAIDGSKLRAQAWIRHDEGEQIAQASVSAWLGGRELHLIIPLDSSVPRFEPRCCVAYSRLAIVVSRIEPWPRDVMLHIERPQLHLLDTHSLSTP